MLLLCVCLLTLALQAKAQTADNLPVTLSVDLKDTPLSVALQEIEKRSGFSFSYESAIIETLPSVTLRMDNSSLQQVLEELFHPLPLAFQIKGKIIILKYRNRQVTISGFVRDRVSSEPLTGASVYQPVIFHGTTTDNYGFFSLTLDPGDMDLTVSYTGYLAQRLKLRSLRKDTLVTILMESNNSLSEVVVDGDGLGLQSSLNTRMGKLSFDQQTIKSAPVMFGETDVLKTLQLTPGVSNGPEGFAGLYVRGGNQDENLFLIDGMPVYQINHVGGIFSALNPEALRKLDFYKAGFPARYGGRLSSVVDVQTKAGDMNEFHGSMSVGLISGNLNLEGPIMKDRTSFAVSLRRSWLDLFSGPVIAIANKVNGDASDKFSLRYAFHDLNARVDHKFSEKSNLFVSIYNGKDYLKRGEKNTWDNLSLPYSSNTKTTLDWGNQAITVGWVHQYNSRLSGRISSVVTRYYSIMKARQANEIKEEETGLFQKRETQSKNKTDIMDIGIRSSFDYLPSASHHIRFGGDFLLHCLRPEYRRQSVMEEENEKETQRETVNSDSRIWGKEVSLFVEDDWDISLLVNLNGGIRSTLFSVNGKNYVSVEPRLSLRWLIRNNLSTKFSYVRMNQFMHLINDSFISLPSDAWVPVTDKLKPLVSDQLSLGFYYDLNSSYTFSIEGYYKYMDNLLEYKDYSSTVSAFASWEDKLASGNGRAYGMEFMAARRKGRTTGWIGYTLSWANREFSEINDGLRYPSKYDSRHKFNIMVLHKLSPKVELSAAWTISSGHRQTLSLENFESILSNRHLYVEQDYNIDMDYYAPGQRNNYQLPVYHRLDLGMNIYRPKKSGRMGIWNISIYNAYCRMNPFLVYKSYRFIDSAEEREATGKYSRPVFKQISILPIIPSVSYTYKF